MTVNRCKYYKQKKQVSYDNGVNWEDVIPYEYQRGELYEEESEDCGYIPPEPSACTVAFNISGKYNYIDYVVLVGSSGGTYKLIGSGSSRIATIPYGIKFSGIVFNDTVVQHCAYRTNSTGGTITDGAIFNATITANTCSN